MPVLWAIGATQVLARPVDDHHKVLHRLWHSICGWERNGWRYYVRANRRSAPCNEWHFAKFMGWGLYLVCLRGTEQNLPSKWQANGASAASGAKVMKHVCSIASIQDAAIHRHAQHAIYDLTGSVSWRATGSSAKLAVWVDVSDRGRWRSAAGVWHGDDVERGVVVLPNSIYGDKHVSP